MPKTKIDKVLKELDKYKKKDYSFSNGQILGSMCTQPHPIAKKALMKFFDTNLGDPKLFPGTKEIEEKYILFLKNILNAPKSSTAIIGSGGTESNITAIWIAKNLSSKKEVIVPKSAHFSFKKIASLMDIKIIPISLNKKYVLDTKELKNKINKNTAAVVGIAGSTELGKIDHIAEIGDICLDENIFLHIDAAFGGYVIPFLRKISNNILDFDFKIKGVNSISIDAHKMGCSVIPMGSLMIRNKEWLKYINVETPYISIRKQAGITGTRSGGSVAAAYAVARYLGLEGYKKIVRKCMNNTKYLEKKIYDMGLKPVVAPTMNVIAIKLKNPDIITKKLYKKGWVVNEMNRFSAIRIVLMPHVTREIINNFLPVFKKVCKESKEI